MHTRARIASDTRKGVNMAKVARVSSNRALKLMYRPDLQEPEISVPPKMKTVKVTKKRGPSSRRRPLIADVMGARGDDPSKLPRKARATKVQVLVFKTGRGVERKALEAYLTRCRAVNCKGQECGSTNTRTTNLGWRCSHHLPFRGARQDLRNARMSKGGRWA